MSGQNAGGGAVGALATRHPGGGPTLRGYARFLRRHRLLVIGLALLGGLVGVGLVLATPPAYAAQVKVALGPVPTGAVTTPEQPQLVSVDSYAGLAVSAAVLGPAAERAAYPGGPDALLDAVRISAVPNARVLIVRVTDADRDQALAAAGAIAAELLRVAGAAEVARYDAVTADLSAEVTAVQAQLTELQSAGAAPTAGTSAAATTLGRELVGRLTDLQDELRAVTTGGPTPPGVSIAPPEAPAAGARPMAAGSVLSGVLLGMMAGTTAGAVVDAGRVRSAARRIGTPDRVRLPQVVEP